jgi:beta-lactamase regulating signal transducer with metallopeptidase domain
MIPGTLPVDRASVESLGWTLIHFVWQGTLIATLLAITNVILSRASARARYLASCVAMLAMLALPIVTFLIARASRVDVPARATVLPLEATRAARAPRPASPRLASAPRAGLATTPHAARTPLRSGSPRALRASLPTLDPTRWLPFVSRDLRTWLPGIVGVWIVGVLLLTLRLLGGWWRVRQLSRCPDNVPLEQWQRSLARLAQAMGLRRTVRLCRSALVEVPTAIGFVKPVILLPASTLTGLSASQIEAILAHELAHIRRHDYLVNLLQSMIETLLFYHPAVWWVSRRVRDERELCCDDLAVRVCGDPVGYAKALCALERLRSEPMGLAVAANGGSLLSRIARLLGANEGKSDSPRGLIGAIAALAMIAALLFSGLDVTAAARPRDVRAPRPAPRAHPADVLAVSVPAVPRVPLTPTPAPPACVAPTPCAETLAPCAAPPAPCAVIEPVDIAEALEAAANAISAAPLAPMASALQAAAAIAPLPPRCDTDPADADDLPDLDDTDVADEDQGAIEELSDLTPKEVQRLAEHGVDRRYLNRIKAAGYTSLSVSQLISLAQHGVTPEYARGIRRAGLDPVSVQDLIDLANHGVTPEYVGGMRGIEPHAPSVREMIELANHGITAEWYSAMVWLGYGDLSIQQAIRLANSGITPDYVGQIRVLVRQKLGAEELVRLVQQGVSPEFVAELRGLVRRDLTVEDLVRLRQQGVTPDFVESMKALGYGDIGAEELIRLRQQGVDADYVAEMTGCVTTHLGVEDLVRLRQNGVTSEFVDQARRAGYLRPSVEELIRLRRRGLPDR